MKLKVNTVDCLMISFCTKGGTWVFSFYTCLLCGGDSARRGRCRITKENCSVGKVLRHPAGNQKFSFRVALEHGVSLATDLAGLHGPVD